MTILLVRHAQPVAPGDARFEENQRPLSEQGRRQAQRLADELAAEPVAAVYASPYPRAAETVAPLAERLGQPLQTIDDLRERLLSTGPLPDWLEHVRRSFADHSYAPAGGESSAQAEARMSAVLATLERRHGGDTVVAASHGNLIALALHARAPERVGFDLWQSMPMPAVYRLESGTSPTGPGLDG